MAIATVLLFTAQKLGMAYCTRESLIPESHLSDDLYMMVALIDSLTALWVGAMLAIRCVCSWVRNEWQLSFVSFGRCRWSLVVTN